MKRKFISFLCAGLMLTGTFSMAVSAAETETKKVTLNEVAHSIFYAPQYVAIELGYFEEEGIDLELVCGFGADKVMTAVISGDARYDRHYRAETDGL